MIHRSKAPAWRRLLAAAAAAAVVASAAFAAESVESLGFEPEQLHQSLFSALRGWYYAPPVPSVVRALPAAQRVAAVNTLGAFAKAYFASDEFKKDYGKAYKETKPKGFGLPRINPEALAKAALDKAQNKSKADNGTLEKSPDAQLKKRLEAFLASTADVDFAATTRSGGGMRYFEKPEYESKPSEWKMCFRAGKETTEALRAFARGWLEELNQGNPR